LKRKLSELIELKLVTWKSVPDRISELELLKLKVTDLKASSDFKDYLKIIKALDHPTRLEILISITNGVKCPCELEFITDLAQATVSHHLSILEDAELIARDRKGKWSILKSEDPKISLKNISQFHISS
ncbi:MAG: ArsR/SmtB family transcription factor, partial [Candidatus Hermodarchaeota archaeon]